MDDLIRKAIELADDWDVSFYDYIDSIFGITITDDALAAQLVRQVDALGDKCHYEVFTNAADTTIKHQLGMMAASFGKDRTMNTIKAIVDSGVLS